MKRFLAILFLVVLCAPMTFLFSSCGEGGSGDVKTLYVYNWGEYISDGSEGSYDTNAEFEKWYEKTYGEKVKVNYSTYASNEDMYAKLSAGAAAYDVVIPSDYMIARMITEGMLRKINKENVPNLEYVNLEMLFGNDNPYYDPTNEYSVPYTYGTVGIIYNTTRVSKEDIGSWDLMWNEKYKGDILQFNNSRDAFMTAQLLLGYSVNSENDEEWVAALNKLLEQKEIVQGYVMDEIFNKMENGSAAISAYYAGDFFTMYGDNEDLAFFYPKEGTNIYVDAMCIPTCSQNPELAERYINFMLSEDAAIANAEYICYASPNRLVYENEEYIAAMEELHEDAMSILYNDIIDKNFQAEYYHNLSPEQLERVNELWEELKIESPISTSIIVLAAVIVASLVAFLVFFALRKRRRKKLVRELWNETA